jgi:hypothetical protein
MRTRAEDDLMPRGGEPFGARGGWSVARAAASGRGDGG